MAISDRNVSPSSVTFGNTGVYTLTGPYGIAGATGLNVAGALLTSASTYTGGLLIVSNTNSYTGTTNISVGTLQIGNAAALPHGPGAGVVQVGDLGTLDLGRFSPTLNGLNGGGTVTNSGSGSVNLTLGDGNASSAFTGVLQNGSGTLALTKIGNGALSLSGTNTYTGGTTIDAGVLSLPTFASYALGTGPITVNSGGMLTTDRTNMANPLVLNGGVLQGTNGWGESWNGPITLAATSTVDAQYGMTFSNIVSGPGGLVVTGGGPLTLTASNTFTGVTTINSGGNLLLANPNALGMSTLDTSGAGVLSFGSLTNVVFGGLQGSGNLVLGNASSADMALTVGGNNTSTTFSGSLGDLNGGGSLTKIGTGTLNLGGNNTYGGGTTLNAGVLQLGNAGALGSGGLIVNGGELDLNGNSINLPSSLVGSGGTISDESSKSIAPTTLTIAQGTATTFGGKIRDGLSGQPVALNMSGSGTLTLSGNNGYSGGTTVQGGTLVLSGSNSISGSTVVNAGTLVAASGSALGASNLTVAGNAAFTYCPPSPDRCASAP